MRFLTAAGAFCAVAVWFCSCEESDDDSYCASDSGFYRYGLGGAVGLAGTAFHAGVFVDDAGFFRNFHLEDGVRADYRTHLTAEAFFAVKLKCNNVF